MAKTMEALLRLQAIERDLAEVRSRLRSRSAAVHAQEVRLGECRAEHDALHRQFLERQKRADAIELDLKQWEERISKLRSSLNVAKTNKGNAAVPTEINTLKADNSKAEDEGLKLIGEVEEARVQVEGAAARIAEAEAMLEELKRTSAEEIAELEVMLKGLTEKREAATRDVPARALVIFDRIAALRDGEVLAPIQVVGRKPPYDYVCGGCNMSITAEHANALRTRDELRFCDCCGRILYLEDQVSALET